MATGKNQSLAKMSPRQKMINLMYIVLTAMLALNVSNDVLNGFSQVEEGLKRSNRTITERNMQIMAQLQAFYNKDPQNGLPLLNSGNDVRNVTDSLYYYIDSLKVMIVKEADGPAGDVNNIVNRDNLDAATLVMLTPSTHRGTDLRLKINQFKSYVSKFIDNPDKLKNIEQALSTEPFKVKADISNKKTWEESMFENMPTVAAISLLSKLQNDVRYAEGEVLNHLLTLTNVEDLSDLKVNWINAFVIPQSRIVMRGSKYQSQIVLAAIDSTQRPTVFINGVRLNNNKGIYEVSTSHSGNFDYSGYIEVVGQDGQLYKRNFKSSYTVIDPIATVSATMMNVFYTGIDNPVSISVPGVGNGTISATMTNGSLVKSGDNWVARPAQVGANCEISVSVDIDGVRTNVGTYTFKARKLPDPTAYINLGQDNRYKGGKPIAKGTLLGVNNLHAAIDDGLLDIEFSVVSFETLTFGSMGEAIPEISQGSAFSERQKTSFRRMKRGTRFFITRIKATGPDGVTREISPMEVVVN
ncbi:MAG: gliding motility protein GldM [Muribaculaceae bacterium]|nr:gliding motility protein GldM [Muribaculaceae bacterium]MBR6488970.1 gliding motility protein GldM [Muribaculaceae bacterium]